MSRIYSRDGRGTLLYSRYENISRSVNVRETRERVERVDFVDAGGRVRYSGGTREQLVTDHRATTNSGLYEQYARNMSWPGSWTDDVRAGEYVPARYLGYNSNEDVESQSHYTADYGGEDDYEDDTTYRGDPSPGPEYHPHSDTMQELEDHTYASYQEESYFPGDYSEYHEEYEGSPEIDDSNENEVYSPPASPELYSDPETLMMATRMMMTMTMTRRKVVEGDRESTLQLHQINRRIKFFKERDNDQPLVEPSY
ncbi:hypothetical protein EDD85DRAFT_266202 [Armillaria nabsnona]|nr:hypothetical protein EDD85DRAFT_266202 [Armillaria nabsnona]